MGKNTGLGTLLTGVVMGAAAVFLSKKENRDKARETLKKASDKAKKLKSDYQKDPEKVKAQLKAEGKRLAEQALKEAKTASKNLQSGNGTTSKAAKK